MKKILNKKVKEVNAITLIALVVTIVILLIISTATITLLINNNLMGQGKYAVDKYNNSVNDENIELAKYTNEIENLHSSREDVQISGVPTGTVISYIAGTSAPEGYLKCDGTEYNIADYKKLADEIKNGFGSCNYWGGDGETTFAVPNLQGEFLRGYSVDSTASKTTGVSTEDIGKHQEGTRNPYIWTHTNSHLYFPKSGYVPEYLDTSYSEQNTGRIYGNSTQNNGYSQGVYYTSRPTNTSVLYCIKY